MQFKSHFYEKVGNNEECHNRASKDVTERIPVL